MMVKARAVKPVERRAQVGGLLEDDHGGEQGQEQPELPPPLFRSDEQGRAGDGGGEPRGREGLEPPGRSGPAFGQPPDLRHHPLLHDEVGRVEDPEAEEPAADAGQLFGPAPGQETGPAGVGRLEGEGAPVPQGHGLARRDERDLPAGVSILLLDQAEHEAGLDAADDVLGLARLPLRPDPVRIVDIGEQEILEPGIAVEARPVLADLGDPGPDLLGRRLDGDGARPRDRAADPGVVAEQGPGLLLFGRSPMQEPGPDGEVVGRDGGQDDPEGGQGPGQPGSLDCDHGFLPSRAAPLYSASRTTQPTRSCRRSRNEQREQVVQALRGDIRPRLMRSAAKSG